jgi:hypothetical protein
MVIFPLRLGLKERDIPVDTDIARAYTRAALLPWWCPFMAPLRKGGACMPPVKTTLPSVPPVMAPVLILSRFFERPQLLTRVSALPIGVHLSTVPMTEGCQRCFMVRPSGRDLQPVVTPKGFTRNICR